MYGQPFVLSSQLPLRRSRGSSGGVYGSLLFYSLNSLLGGVEGAVVVCMAAFCFILSTSSLAE